MRQNCGWYTSLHACANFDASRVLHNAEHVELSQHADFANVYLYKTNKLTFANLTMSVIRCNAMDHDFHALLSNLARHTEAMTHSEPYTTIDDMLIRNESWPVIFYNCMIIVK
jgi:hypothetical protein